MLHARTANLSSCRRTFNKSLIKKQKARAWNSCLLSICLRHHGIELFNWADSPAVKTQCYPQGKAGYLLIRFLINNCACLGHLERSAAESRDLVTVHGLVSYTRFLRLKATSWPSGRNDKSAQFNRIWYNGMTIQHEIACCC